ncbi:hypothetical protein RVF83_21360 [Gordonia rubripertincta]|uniref:Cell division protein FtsL n=2 Tax=Gordonia rubripertincta TaxID=36822 RepID=A0AAW6R4S5_GORRU|nr:hypothetical protein [Gordonia rubripertincta]MDG6779672.1 hypothetical protein [Gordonia rubripertincta]NKY63660.1 hypothetical protein [Gordonia rubripertincta]GAB85943.1 hypothetical protein GORBP_068_00070 [Gordonia rubripertincta NBRC 101908]
MTILHDAPRRPGSGRSDDKHSGSRRFDAGRADAGRADAGRSDTERNSRRSRRARIESERATRSRAAQRALDRRHKRMATGAVAPRAARGGLSMSGVSLRERLQHTPFVVPVIALLVLGLGLSLWLSTKSAQDSYKLGIERTENQSLIDQRDALKRTFESGNSAPELSREATRLGMIPSDNPARMIVDDPRRPRIVGKPAPASGKPMADLNPELKPDPTETIDPRKVDDSIGLGGGAVGAPNPPAQQTPAPSTPGQSGPSPSPQPVPAQPDPVPGQGEGPPPTGSAPAPSTPIPAPNVVPRT